MKIAIVYDWIDKWGGVERMLQVLAETFPQATFFTSVYNAEKAQWAKNLSIKTSFMQSLPFFITSNRVLSAQLYPYAFESFDFSEYDLVISVSSSFAKGIITKPRTKHISILLTPTRYIWDMKEHYKKNAFFTVISAPFLSALRKWDFIAAQRPDTILAISTHVADRCSKAYNREGEVVYPPFDEEYWKSITPVPMPTPESYYLVVSRLESYKKIELAIQAFNELKNEQCIIVGKGTELESMKSLAGSNCTFIPEATDAELAYLYPHAKGLIMPQEEDFGYTALEALYFDCPVISYRNSGAAEIVLENKTGIFFDAQSVESLLTGLERFASVPYNVTSYKADIIKKFAKKVFIDKIKALTK